MVILIHPSGDSLRSEPIEIRVTYSRELYRSDRVEFVRIGVLWAECQPTKSKETASTAMQMCGQTVAVPTGFFDFCVPL